MNDANIQRCKSKIWKGCGSKEVTGLAWSPYKICRYRIPYQMSLILGRRENLTMSCNFTVALIQRQLHTSDKRSKSNHQCHNPFKTRKPSFVASAYRLFPQRLPLTQHKPLLSLLLNYLPLRLKGTIPRAIRLSPETTAL